jgi:hypothetical protein
MAAINRQTTDTLAYICQWHVVDTPIESEAAVMVVLNSYHSGILRDTNGTLVEEQVIESIGIAGREFTFQIGPENLACCRTFFAGSHIVSLQVVGQNKQALSSGDALKFLDSFSIATSKPNDDPYLTRRAQFRSTLLKRSPSPQPWSAEEPPAGVSVVEYDSGGHKLKAWLSVPKLEADEPRPVLVYMHGGFAFAAEDFTVCQPFVDAGYVVLCPMFRGENGNPGDFEMTFGEVDDAAAAIRWIAEPPYVDRERIYSFGHSAGGVISAVLSLYADVPLRYGGSAGGLYGTDLFYFPGQPVPFDRANNVECRLRTLIGNVRWMETLHYAFVGTQDVFMKGVEARQEAVESHAPLEVIDVTGDHQSMLAPAISQFLAITERDG